MNPKECVLDERNARTKLETLVNDVLSRPTDRSCEDERLFWNRLKDISECVHGVSSSRRSSSEHFPVSWRNFLLRVLELLKVNCFSEEWRRTAFDAIFFEGLHSSSLVVLCSVFYQTSSSYKQDALLDMIEHFMKTDCIVMMLVSQSVVQPEDQKHCWKEFITCIASLPEKVANRLQGQFRSFFKLGNFHSHMATVITQTLMRIHQRLELGLDSSLEFLSHLIGRLAIIGNAAYIFQNMTPVMLRLMHKNYLWKKMVQRLLLGIPDRCLESVCAQLFHHIPWYGYVEYFFGDGILNKSILHFLVTNKFILVNFNEIHIAENCLGYMASSDARKDHFFETVETVLDVWGDKSGLVHQTQHQHFYLSCILMIAVGHLKNFKVPVPEHHKNMLNQKLLHGVQNHIGHFMQEVRVQGMIVGQSLAIVLDPNGPKLAFEYDMTPEIEKLSSLTNIPQEPQDDWTDGNEEFFRRIEEMNLESNHETVLNLKEERNKEILDALDSDDDLEPYDLTGDVPNAREKKPYYIRDCLEGLISNTDPDWTKACLESAKELIISEKHTISEIAVDLTRVLLNLEDTSGISNFNLLRFNALVAVCLQCPKQTAAFLTKEFYDRNYNIQQRIDILQVIGATSEELSCLPKRPFLSSVLNSSVSTTFSEKPWDEIVQKRIAEKTRRISKGKTKDVAAVENHFGEVAGCFFFPLMEHFDRKENTFDMLGEDHYMLGHLLYTLGIILNCAANCQIFNQMSKAMMEFVWVLRYHTERFVRRALLFASAMVILNVPPRLLFSDFGIEILEYQQWLKDIVQQDPDDTCRKQAVQLLEFMSRVAANYYNTNQAQ